MALTLEQIRELVLEGESNRLDFKREQYRFIGLSGPDGDKEKAKLLKDVLAFANAFRKDRAFILVGVDESLPRDQAVAGIPTQDVIDDATLQQFVNFKTNRTIPFRAYSVPCSNDKVVQVVEIDPCADQRPFYLKKGFGGILQEEVWFRSGSSKTKATPGDIYRMGAEQCKQNRPVLECTIESPNLIPGTNRLGIIKATADLPPEPPSPYRTFGFPAYMREPTDQERISQIQEELEVVSFSVHIWNRSALSAEKILAEVFISGEEGKQHETVDLADFFDDPMRLRVNPFRMPSLHSSFLRPGEESADFGTKTIRILDGKSIDVSVRVFADNLEPIVLSRHFDLETIPIVLPKDKIKEVDKILSSPKTIFEGIRVLVNNNSKQAEAAKVATP